jgi:hypothetical protein
VGVADADAIGVEISRVDFGPSDAIEVEISRVDFGPSDTIGVEISRVDFGPSDTGTILIGVAIGEERGTVDTRGGGGVAIATRLTESGPLLFFLSITIGAFGARPKMRNSVLRSTSPSRSVTMFPLKQKLMVPRSSLTTITTASVSSVIPIAAR